MHPLANAGFNPNLPLQTMFGTTQALRCGKTAVNHLIKAGKLEIVRNGRTTRITTRSINALIEENAETLPAA